jgi:hypothetical protein
MVLRHEARILERQLHGRVRYRRVDAGCSRRVGRVLDAEGSAMFDRSVSGALRTRTGAWLGRA